MDGYDINRGTGIYLGMLDNETAKKEIEHGVYPVAISGSISYDFLKEYGNFYVQLANNDLESPLYFLETSEKLNAHKIIPAQEGATHVLIAESIYPNSSPNDATYVGNDGVKYRVSEYTGRILTEMTKESGRSR